MVPINRAQPAKSYIYMYVVLTMVEKASSICEWGINIYAFMDITTDGDGIDWHWLALSLGGMTDMQLDSMI